MLVNHHVISDGNNMLVNQHVRRELGGTVFHKSGPLTTKIATLVVNKLVNQNVFDQVVNKLVNQKLVLEINPLNSPIRPPYNSTSPSHHPLPHVHSTISRS